MDFPQHILDKYRPREREIGEPRSQRDDLIATFLKTLNEEQERDGYPPYTTGRLVKMFKGRPDSELYGLYQSCLRGRSFGGLLAHLLKKV